jgi:hypothetical protein
MKYELLIYICSLINKNLTMKLKVLIILLPFLFSLPLAAQSNKKKKDKKKTQTDTVSVASVEFAAFEEVSSTNDQSSVSTSFEPLKSIRFNSKYEVNGSVNDQFDYYCEANSPNKYSNLGIVDKKGNVILPHLFGKVYRNHNNNEALLHINSNYGLFNLSELRWTIPMEYEEMEDLDNNLFKAKKNGKWGIIDNKNNVIVPLEWNSISTISNLENYIIVSDNSYPNNLKGIYSLVERKLTVPCTYTYLDKIDNQNYFTVRNGLKYNIIDINDTVRFKTWYDEINVPSKGRNYYIVKSENRYGVIDDKEKVIIPIEYLEFAQYSYSDGSYLARNKEGKYGFIAIDGKITLPFEYDNLSKRYYDNVVSVRNGKCGLVQVNSGVPYEIVTCDYDDIKSGSKTFIVEKGGKFGILDLFGKPLTEMIYSSIDALEESSYDTQIYKAKKDNYYQLIDGSGKAITNEEYTDIQPIIKKSSSSYYSSKKFSYLKAQVKNGKFCIIDKVGRAITKPIFDNIVTENENLFIVTSNKKYGLYSLLNQKLIVNYQYDLIIKTNENFFGFLGKKIDILNINSDQITTISTTK